MLFYPDGRAGSCFRYVTAAAVVYVAQYNGQKPVARQEIHSPDQARPHMAEQRCQPPKINRVHSGGGMARSTANMRAHNFWREEVAHPSLNLLAIKSVVAV